MKKSFYLLMVISLVMVSCKTEEARVNPLLADWNTPFGIPPFEQVELGDYIPAYEEAIAQHNAEIEAILSNPAEPDFENTIAAYDKCGALLRKISPVFSSLSGVNSNDEVRALAADISKMTSAHNNEVSLNPRLFERIKAVYDKKESLNLNEEQMRILTKMYDGLVRNGAALPDDQKAVLKSVNEQLSAEQLKFGQNKTVETGSFKLIIDNKDELAGLSEDKIAAAATRAARDSATAGKWVFGLDNPSLMPFLQQADNRDHRITMLNGYLNIANNNNGNDNKSVIKNLIALRLQKAQIMGHKSFADYTLETRMAKNKEAVYKLLDELWKPALAVSKKELADMAVIARKDGINTLDAADWRYYFEKAKASKFNLSDDQLSPYFKLENVRDGIFELCKKLYGITFTQLHNVPLPHPDATAFECKDADGTHLGLLFMDMFARPGTKNSGAWCGGYRTQSYENGTRIAPLVNIACNFSAPVSGKPSLLTPDEVNTFFHEFGHALHSLFKDVSYYGISGTERDFVELPSQIMEHWAFEPELLKLYAKHYETGEIIPQDLIEKLDKSGKYGQGFVTVEYLAASYLDMDFHILESIPAGLDIATFENDVLNKKRGLISQIPPRYRSTYFSHTFGGGYTAGYHAYIWAEVLDCDAYDAFVETGDIFNKEVAAKFREEVLSKGGMRDGMVLYTNFRGKTPSTEPLLRNRGLK